ncbi:beta-glucosidase BoGH3B-like [Panicum miliaceum]|uniref:Beta-glucosidase BoGH3B-like n=1 Tax=Panicum miliaceum TaxID=4540 RepID=A0A3L6SCE2_PANMI|nr:beta-glucosidase BoGH3B-like [Panicum miliaceum]
MRSSRFVSSTMARSPPAAAVACLLVAAVLLPAAAAEKAKAEYVKYKDPKQPINERVDDLLNRMTLEEKIGQMSQIERANATTEVIEKYFVGSVLSGGGSVPSEKATASVWQKMVAAMQKAALKTRLGIPIIYGIDAVHGNNNVYNATIFPHNVGLGATRDPNLVKRIGDATAHEARATGIPYTFAPCVAVCRDPRWGRCYESYSEDTRLVQLMTSSMVTGLQGDVPSKHPKGVPFVGGSKKVAGCAKHFVGDGGTQRGINENNTVLSFHDLMRIHMPPYDNAVIKGISTVMISYSSFNGVKMHENKFLITDTLKNKMNFRGFVITDWQAVDRITNPPHKHYYHSIEETIHAGIDMVMIPYDYPEFVADVVKQVNAGQIRLDRVNDAVSRILRVKFTMGLFEDPLPDPRLAKELGSKEHRAIAREAVRKSLVLLKNSKKGHKEGMLPLSKNAKKVLVAGSHAHDLGNQCGGWTIKWQGESGNNLTGAGTTILEAIKKAVSKNTTVDYVEHPDKDDLAKGAGEYDYAVVAVGEPPYAETAGDNQNLTIPSPGPEVIKDVCGLVKCAVLVVSGRPLVVQPYVEYMDALVAAWLPGTEGQGVADVLFGDYGFTGKLPRTWFKSVDQLPMNYGDKRYDPLFPFGFGITTKAAGHD